MLFVIDREEKMKLIKFMLYLPCYIFSFFTIMLLLFNEVINIWVAVIIILNLWLIAYGINKNSKKYNIVSFIVLTFFSIFLVIQGCYDDYFKYFHFKIAIFLILYFSIIFLIKKYISKTR